MIVNITLKYDGRLWAAVGFYYLSKLTYAHI